MANSKTTSQKDNLKDIKHALNQISDFTDRSENGNVIIMGTHTEDRIKIDFIRIHFSFDTNLYTYNSTNKRVDLAMTYYGFVKVSKETFNNRQLVWNNLTK